MREELGMHHRRSAFVTYAKSGSADLVDLKMALALACQNARNGGYDAPDGRWESLMEAMAAADFMNSEGLIEMDKLAAATNERLPKPLDAEEVKENPTKVIGVALEELDFISKGL